MVCTSFSLLGMVKLLASVVESMYLFIRKPPLTQGHKYILLHFMLEVLSVCVFILTFIQEEHHKAS